MAFRELDDDERAKVAERAQDPDTLTRDWITRFPILSTMIRETAQEQAVEAGIDDAGLLALIEGVAVGAAICTTIMFEDQCQCPAPLGLDGDKR